jgi:chromosome segregation ATPase
VLLDESDASRAASTSSPRRRGSACRASSCLSGGEKALTAMAP